MSFGYDAAGNRTNVTDALAHTTSFGYDALSRLTGVTNALGKVWTFTVDAEGRRTRSTDPNAHINSFAYDAVGQVTGWTNGNNQAAAFGYDPLGNLGTVTDARGNALLFRYDAVSRLTNITYAGLSTEAFRYDAVGNLTGFVNRASQTVSLTYDVADRLTQKSYVGTNLVIKFSYDAANQLTGVVWTAGTATNSALSFRYDAAGRLTNENQKVETAAALNVGYQYYADGRRKRLTYPDGTFITYTYNSNGWLTAILDSGTLTVVSYQYDAAGRRTKRTLANSTFTVYDYDNADQLTNIWHRQVSGNTTNTISQYQYGYDGAGNRVWVKRKDSRGDVYRYDGADQLTNVLYNANTPDTTPTGWTNDTRFVFDAAGNRTSLKEIFATKTNTTSYGANNLNQYTNVNTSVYRYDAKGNLTNDTTWVYSYDHENRLTKAVSGGTTVTYLYDALGRLVQRKVGNTATRFYYAGEPSPGYGLTSWQLIEERDGSAKVLAKYVYGPGIDEPVRMTRGTTKYWYHADGLGSITEVTGNTGALSEQYSYDVYGKPTLKNATGKVITTSAVSNRLMFTARDRDPNTTLYNYRYRYYSPALGRFMQPDPININGGDVNLYRYVRNNPVFWTDPLGLAVGDWWDIPANYKRVNQIFLEELQMYPGHNDLGDAMRHADASRRITCEIGPFTAWAASFVHELRNRIWDRQPWRESAMDLHNNLEGRMASQERRPINASNLQTLPNQPLPYTTDQHGVWY